MPWKYDLKAWVFELLLVPPISENPVILFFFLEPCNIDRYSATSVLERQRVWEYLLVASVCSPTVIASVIHENNAFGFTGIEILFQVSFKGIWESI